MTDTIQDRLRRTTPARDAAFGVVGQMPVNPDGPDAAAYIDAQDAKIKALVEELESVEQEMRDTGNCIAEVPQERAPSRDEICRYFDDYADRIRTALAAAKETTA